MSPISLEQPESPVPPGNKTGVYYIIIAGLPFRCSWQDLKDFARNRLDDGTYINIDHAMVYPKSTDGWVRVKGKTAFLKAFSKLDLSLERNLIDFFQNTLMVVYLETARCLRMIAMPQSGRTLKT